MARTDGPWSAVDFAVSHLYDRAVSQPAARDLRAAKVAHVISRAVRDGEIEASDALRILRHELRRRTNASLRIARRSNGAQASVDTYAPDLPPKNGSPDALHADHVNTLRGGAVDSGHNSRGLGRRTRAPQ